ncbi:MAG: hydrolase [Gemmatimonadota bacterium]|nr:hydrolase [Gemmatimonadota bacterium]
MKTQAAPGESRANSDVPTFRPFPGLGNPHAQTVGARIRRARLRPRYRRVRIDTDDGDFLDLDIRELDRPPVATCLLLHGLEGCAASGYMLSSAEAMAARGVLPVSLNFRSCSGEPNRTLGSYHSGRTDDVRRALAWIDGEHPGLPRGAVGFSLGGNALLVHMGSAGPAAGLEAAVATSVPYELAECADELGRGLGRVYGRYFMRRLKSKLVEKARRFPADVPERALRSTSVREFDDTFTAPVHGFRDADDYYERCSAARFVAGVTVPTLLLQASDDPLVPARSIPLHLISANPCLELHMTARGGHVGYYGREDRGNRPGWMEGRLADYLARRLVDV